MQDYNECDYLVLAKGGYHAGVDLAELCNKFLSIPARDRYAFTDDDNNKPRILNFLYLLYTSLPVPFDKSTSPFLRT